MNQIYVDIIQSMSGVVTILAGFLSAFFYLRKRTRDWKVIITASLAIAILIGAGFYGFGGPQVVKSAVVNIAPTPKHTLNDYCKYYLAGDHSAIYDMYSTKSLVREHITRAAAIKHTVDYIKTVNGVNSCIADDDIKENGNDAEGTVTIIFGNGQFTKGDFLLKKEGNEWKLFFLK